MNIINNQKLSEMKILATKQLEDLHKKYGTLYPELLKAAKSIERCNIIDAYFAGAMDRIVNKVDIDNYLKIYENETITTEKLPD